MANYGTFFLFDPNDVFGELFEELFDFVVVIFFGRRMFLNEDVFSRFCGGDLFWKKDVFGRRMFLAGAISRCGHFSFGMESPCIPQRTFRWMQPKRVPA